MPTPREDSDTTPWDKGTGSPQTLLDLCGDSFLLIFHIHGANDPGHPEDLRKSVSLLFQNLERQAKRQGQSDEDIKATQYALCALIDETILNSRWAFKDQWTERPLQLEYFGEHMAGERFFDLLARIRQKGSRKVDLLEVFCMCLILGFQGKYKLGGQEELAQLTRTLMEEAISFRGGLSGLARHWKVPEESVELPVKSIPQWAWITGVTSVLVVVLFYVTYKLLLWSATADAVRRMIL
jgi:type VI secretion system protein ImpK